jgi:LacI family transcriptional regulator
MSIVEVARLAGVSNSTVSRVINNHPRVLPETARAVRAAMATLRYTPSDRRPGPKRGPRARPKPKTIAIGLFVLGSAADRVTPGFEQLMRGVSRGVDALGVKLVYQQLPDPESLVAHLQNTQVDGLLLHGLLPSATVRAQVKVRPTVWLMGNRRRPDWGDQVMPDSYEVGDKAARYLLSLGHRHLACFNIDQNHWPFRVARPSFANAANEASATVTVLSAIRDEQSPWPQSAAGPAEEIVARFLRLTPRPTGLFVADDMQVAILQPALQRAGVAIEPGKIDVISCNNERPYLMGLTPTPAEIDIRVEAIGFRGVERLLWRIRNPGVRERMITAVDPAVIDPRGKNFELRI